MRLDGCPCLDRSVRLVEAASLEDDRAKLIDRTRAMSAVEIRRLLKNRRK